MTRLNFDHYFENTDIEYYDSKYLITILENILGNNIVNIKNRVNDIKISVTAEQIKTFLEETFEEKDPELKRKIESPKPKRSGNIGKWTEQDIEDFSQEIVDRLSARRYCFEPYTLEYFNKYSAIIRNKALLLLSIIEKIGNKEHTTILDLLSEFDIQLDQNGNISKEDIIRLITPTIHNINELNEMVHTANDLSTYLTFSISKHSLYKDGINEVDIYPTNSIQINDLSNDYIQGNISLSNKQREKLKQEKIKNLKISCAEVFDNLFS